MAKARTRSRRQKRARKAANTGIRISRRVVREVGAIILVVLALVSLLAVLTPDAAAGVALWRDFLETMLGWGIFFAPGAPPAGRAPALDAERCRPSGSSPPSACCS